MFDKHTVEKSMPLLEITKIFPSSGQKQVFLVIHKIYGTVILKIVKEFNERITREIDIVTENEIINVPKIIEANTANIDGTEYFYIIEEYIDGHTLKEFLSVKTLSVEEGILLLETLLKIVVQLENIQVVHRDIKPDNIIYGMDKKFYLIDFGIARNLKLESLTLTRMAIGPHTPGYGAPELFQYNKSNINSKADLFSIGIVKFETS